MPNAIAPTTRLLFQRGLQFSQKGLNHHNNYQNKRFLFGFRPASMTKTSSLNSGNGGIVYTPTFGAHSATVIFMHGLGDSADGMSDLAEMFTKQLPHLKFVLPTAPQMAVTLNMGHRMNAWYDITSLDDRSHDTNPGIDESALYVKSLIQAELDHGVPMSRIMLMGFSQGGAMSVYTGLQRQFIESDRLAGLLVLSGYLPNGKNFKLGEGLESTPILHCHGSADPVVRYSWAERTKEELTKQGVAQYALKSFAGVQHSISMDIVRDAATFLQTCLPADYPAFKPKDPTTMSVKELKEIIRDNGLSSQAVGLTEKSEFVQLVKDFLASRGFTY